MQDLRNYIHPNTPAHREQERTRSKFETTSDAMLIQAHGVMSKVSSALGINRSQFRVHVNKAPRGVPAYLVVDGHIYRLHDPVTKPKK